MYNTPYPLWPPQQPPCPPTPYTKHSDPPMDFRTKNVWTSRELAFFFLFIYDFEYMESLRDDSTFVAHTPVIELRILNPLSRPWSSIPASGCSEGLDLYYWTVWKIFRTECMLNLLPFGGGGRGGGCPPAFFITHTMSQASPTPCVRPMVM